MGAPAVLDAQAPKDAQCTNRLKPPATRTAHHTKYAAGCERSWSKFSGFKRRTASQNQVTEREPPQKKNAIGRARKLASDLERQLGQCRFGCVAPCSNTATSRRIALGHERTRARSAEVAATKKSVQIRRAAFITRVGRMGACWGWAQHHFAMEGPWACCLIFARGANQAQSLAHVRPRCARSKRSAAPLGRPGLDLKAASPITGPFLGLPL